MQPAVISASSLPGLFCSCVLLVVEEAVSCEDTAILPAVCKAGQVFTSQECKGEFVCPISELRAIKNTML